MTHISRRLLAATVVITLALAASLVATADQSTSAFVDGAKTAALTQPVPVDPAITTGRLPNGLRYFIRQNTRPEKRAELRLVVNVGSIVEDDDQQGLAHFVEHMAFNGTKNFPKLAIVSFMESIGMRFGPSVNAFTSFDETVYMLQIPTDKPDVIEKSFQILEDWAHLLTFDPVEIDKERGVVMEEWRGRRGASARLQDLQFPVLLKGSRYAERLPIGKPEILQNFKPERLRQFYADWYRPDLMAVVAVGDFTPATIEGLVKSHFGGITAPAKPRPRASFDVPDHAGTLFAIASDPEMTVSTVSAYNKLPLRDPTTIGAYRQGLVEALYSGMFNARLGELAQKPDPPFMAAQSARGQFVRTKEASMLNAMVKEDGIERGLDAVFTEAERVARFGFTATELARQKTIVLRGYEQALAERERQQSASLADEYVRHATTRESIPGIAYEQALAARFVPEVTLEEVNRLAKDFIGDRNRVVLVSAPKKEGLALPTEAQLTKVLTGVGAKTITAYTETTDLQPLMATMPAPGTIVKTATRPAMQITEWQLSNGARVVLRPTDFKQDEVLFRAVSPGGTSLASDADFIPASTAADLMGVGGVGKFSTIELRKVLAGKVASVSAEIGETDEGMSGIASPKDLETLFQLIHLNFTEPRADETLFKILVEQSKALLANQAATPDYAFNEALVSALTQDHLRARPFKVEDVPKMDLQKSLAFYKERFADASDFTFVFVGSFEIDAIRPLVERYLASLPSINRRETWKDTGINPPKGVVERRVEKGLEPKSQTSLVFAGPMQYNQAERVAIRSLSLVLETRLREILREDLGGTYGVSVSGNYSKLPDQEFSVSIDFGSAPDRADALLQSVFKDIAALKANGPTAAQVNDVKTLLTRDFETNSKQNGWLLAQLYLKYYYGEEPESLLKVPEFYAGITAATIQEAAKKYLDSSNYVKVVLLPQKKAG
jgi:zinc protease